MGEPGSNDVRGKADSAASGAAVDLIGSAGNPYSAEPQSASSEVRNGEGFRNPPVPVAHRPDLLAAHAHRIAARNLTETELRAFEPVETAAPPAMLLKHGVLPVAGQDGRPVLICGARADAASIRRHVAPALNGARVLTAPRRSVQDRIAELHRDALVHAARTRVRVSESCRGWSGRLRVRLALASGVLAVLSMLAAAFPREAFAVVAAWASFALTVSALFKAAAFVAGLYPDRGVKACSDHAPTAPLPKVSILVPLFRETEIARALIARLMRLSYPKDLLEVVLVLEEEDDMTRTALGQIALPGWMRCVVVPDGQPRTKPRAMNFALDFCEGQIIGIFDAEDAPDPDQVSRVVRRFGQAPGKVACLQGILDYYNPCQTWLARCFTIEYASWFRVILPGLVRLGFAIPLGGTTLYFRREILEKLGGWDAHNVTEDADLGFRLARHGYRTEMLDTVTEEEANCRPLPWIRQRSRWLKGYMMTYLVHMRRPGRLYRQLGAWKFWGFQAHFLTALSQFLLAPVIWSFWLIFLGLPHPLDVYLPRSALVWLGSAFLMMEILNFIIYFSALLRTRHRYLFIWVPVMHLYAPLGIVAAYKALYEIVLKPFFWDKTAHGLSQAGQMPPLRRTLSDAAVDLS